MPAYLHRWLILVALVCGSTSARAADSIAVEGVVDAPVSAVWKAWTTSAGLESWLAPHADIDLRINGLMRTQYEPKGKLGDAGTIENQVLAFEPERMFSIRVAKAPADFPFRKVIGAMWTVVYLTAQGSDRTNVRIVGLGFAADEESQKMKAFFEQGNALTLTELQKHFAK